MYKKFDAKIDALLAKMSLHDKIGQLNQPCTPLPHQVEQFKEWIRKGEIGSILMAVGATAGNDPQGAIDVDFYNELQRIAVEESPAGIPMIFGRDVIHGHRTVFPIPLAMAASFDFDLVEQSYVDVAREAANETVHWTFTPMLDLSRDPRWGRIIEGPGEDPLVGACMAKAVVKGCQGEDVSHKDRMVACAKHYIGYGAAEGGRDYHRTEISNYSLYNYYLPAFRAAAEAGVGTYMSSFNEINGQPVTSSKFYLTDVLRGQLGFEGFVVSDYGCVEQLIKQGVTDDRGEASSMAIEAGLDMDMYDFCYIENLEEQVKNGRIPESVIDTAVRRVLRLKMAKGLFEDPYCKPEKFDRNVHLAHAREMAANSMVLLKNDGVLPLKKDMNIGLIGPFINERRSLLGSWTVDGKAEETPTLLEAMTEAVEGKGKIHANVGISLDKDFTFRMADRGDVVVLALGESWARTGENKAVSDITITEDQKSLFKKVKATGKKMVGVFFCGRPIAMEGIAEYFDAILYAWHSGSETTHAVCDVLFGDVVPSGRLPVTMPRLATHIPLYYNVTPSGRPCNCYYGENPGNCYVDSYPTPYYPFGYGLSYTKFVYNDIINCANPEVSLADLEAGKTFKLSIEVANAGDYDAKELVQLYIHDPVAKMMRPMRELKAFEKTFIKKGETALVEFELGYKDLGYYTAEGDYTVEPGKIEVFIGENCLTERMTEIVIK
ncbi:MAG: glycoside hydrolase family 3 C-terminal domain-containing protein [Clostridia bacterium]|nr:glycoside hydrolase family 3 C-terminal domain-containing protein [Clostridia bacterium]